MKGIKLICCMLFLVLISTYAAAQDKVVIIPMGGSKNTGTAVGGNDKQVQYNNNSSLDGAEIYYDNSTGYLGIGPYATTPEANLNIVSDDVAKAWLQSLNASVLQLSSEGSSKILMQVNSDASFPLILGTRARGTSTSPTAAQTDDTLLGFFAKGRGETKFNPGVTAGQIFKAAENYTDTAMGTYISFYTTPIGSIDKAERLRIDDSGNVGIGTSSPLSKLAVSGLPTAPPNDGSVSSGIVCTTANGNFWLDTDGTPDCAHP